MQGVIVWNSHAFNLTEIDSTLDQYLSLYLASAADRLYPARAIFDTSHTFSQYIAPYETQEVCKTYTLPRYSHLFNLGSHTHRFGVRWRAWLPPNDNCTPVGQGNPNTGEGCSPRSDPAVYYSTEYSDPVSLGIVPPLYLDSADSRDRTPLFCSLYDNVSGPGSPTLKRASTSPDAPAFFNGLVPGGGPCSNDVIACAEGAIFGDLCNGNDSACDSNDCDACPVVGGVTTEDEMFIPLGSYYVAVPEPSFGLLMYSGLASLLCMARRHGTRNRLDLGSEHRKNKAPL